MKDSCLEVVMNRLPKQCDLHELFDYNKDSGELTWKKSRGRARAGDIAGWKTNNGYMRVLIKGKKYYVHRLIWVFVHGDVDVEQIDHINGTRDDNRLENLRSVALKENRKNLKRHKHNSTGITGVRWLKQHQCWKSDIGLSGKLKHIGMFNNLFDAACARRSAEIRYGYHKNHGRVA